MKTYIDSTNLKLEILFQVMKKRIARGFKASDLSFLIGMDHDYIDNIECFDTPSYTRQDLDIVAEVLGDQLILSILKRNINEYSLRVSMERHLFESRYFHICTSYSSEGLPHVQFILTEDVALKQRFAIDQLKNHQRQRIKQKISAMQDEGYFEQPRLPYQIYQQITKSIGLDPDPQMVKEILNDFCLDDGIGGLKKTYENNRYQYTNSNIQLHSFLLTLNTQMPC